MLASMNAKHDTSDNGSESTQRRPQRWQLPSIESVLLCSVGGALGWTLNWLTSTPGASEQVKQAVVGFFVG